MRLLIAGSSGFLGQQLTTTLEDHGHQVTRLVRRAPRGEGEREWDPEAGRLDRDLVGQVDVVVNLAGSPTAGNPHSARWARELMHSRVQTTRLLAEAIAATPDPPAYLAGNGISVYGDHGADPLPESADSRGDALLTRVTRAWQEATVAATDAGARVCVLRTAPVLDRRSPPLRQLWPLFRAGLGARLGSGRQYFPVISTRDWVAAVIFLATHPTASGPVNLCCPSTPTNAEFTEALAAAAGRRARLKAPEFVLARAAGAMAPELLGSLNAVPQALLEAGYQFRDHDVRDVLAAALDRS